MPAFLLSVNKVLDDARFFATYAKEVQPVTVKYGGKYRILALKPTLLEGGADAEGASVVIIEWPNMEAALQFWNSPEYQKVKKLREGISEVRAWLFEAPGWILLDPGGGAEEPLAFLIR